VLGEVWSVPQDVDISHPHPFPVELAQRCIPCATAQIVLDPFIGSGSTAIAAENLKRAGVKIDNSREYWKMTEKRVEKSRTSTGVAGTLNGRSGDARRGQCHRVRGAASIRVAYQSLLAPNG